MIRISNDPQAQLIAFVRSWFRLLSRDEWAAALAMLDEPNSYGIRWTKEGIIGLLHETFAADTVSSADELPPGFSDPDLAEGTAHHAFGEIDGGGYWLDHDVPLNGTFSDLTAQFEFLPRATGHAAILHDLHVM